MISNQMLLTVKIRALLVNLGSQTIGRRVAAGAVWSFTGAISSKALVLLTSVLIARKVGSQSFGELGIVQNTAVVFQVFAGFSLGVTATRYVSAFKKSDPDRAGNIIAVSNCVALAAGLCLSVLLLVLAPWIASYFFSTPSAAKLLRIGSLFLLMSSLNASQTGSLSGLESFKTLAKISVAASIVTFGLSLAFLMLWSLPGVIWAMGIGMGFNCLLNSVTLSRLLKQHRIRVSVRSGMRELRVLWDFSFPAAMSAILVMPANWICTALLVKHSNGLSQLGILNAANQCFTMVLFLPTVLGQALLPIISETLGSGSHVLPKRILQVSTALNACLIFPVVSLGILCSNMILSTYGPEFSNSGTVLTLLLLTAGLVSITMPVGDVLVASGRMWVGFFMNLTWAVTLILSTYALISQGAQGLAEGRLIAYSFHAVWTFAVACKCLNLEKKTALNTLLCEQAA